MKNKTLTNHAFFLLTHTEDLYQQKSYKKALDCLYSLMQHMEISLRSTENTETRAPIAIAIIRKMKQYYQNNQSLSCLKLCLALAANNLLSTDLVIPWAHKAYAQFEQHIYTKLEKQEILAIKQQEQGFFKLANLALSQEKNCYNSGSKKLSHKMLEKASDEISEKLRAQLEDLKSINTQSNKHFEQLHNKKINLLERKLKNCETIRREASIKLSPANFASGSSPATVASSMSPDTTPEDSAGNAKMGDNHSGLMPKPAAMPASTNPDHANSVTLTRK